MAIKRRTYVTPLLYAVSIALSLSPLYGLGLAIAIVLVALRLDVLSAFSSFFSRIILSFLLQAATMMFAGLITWSLNVPVLPFATLVLFYFFMWALTALKAPPRESRPRFVLADRGDIISLSVALLAPVLMFVSFYAPTASHASTYQILSNGWDNGSHYNMIQTDSREKGYVYGTMEAVKKQDPTGRQHAYPQGWHLTVAMMASGFGFQPFDVSRPLIGMTVYLLAVIVWYVVTAYVFARIAWKLLERLVGTQAIGWSSVALFVVANIFVGLVLFYDTLTRGFPNYLVCFLYILLVSAAAIELRRDRAYPLILFSALTGMAATLTWLLPAPAILLTVALACLFVIPDVKLRPLRKKIIATLLLILPLFVAVLAQAAIFIGFSDVENSQLNEGAAGASLKISTPLALIVLAYAAAYFIAVRRKVAAAPQFAIAIVPLLILTVGIFAYQTLSTGNTSYYFGKVLGLLFGVASIFFVAAFVVGMRSIRFPTLIRPYAALLVGVIVLVTLTTGSGQSLTQGSDTLLQKNSKVTYPVAQKIISYVKREDMRQTKVIVLRAKGHVEDRNGDFASKLPNLALTCTRHIVTKNNFNKGLRRKINNLERCAKELDDKRIIVITSNKTRQAVAKLSLPNISIVNIP